MNNTDNLFYCEEERETMSALVEIQDISKIYNPGENEVRALDHISLTIQKGEFVAIIGQSGSGKSARARRR